jgi:hypothetical protein
MVEEEVDMGVIRNRQRNAALSETAGAAAGARRKIGALLAGAMMFGMLALAGCSSAQHDKAASGASSTAASPAADAQAGGAANEQAVPNAKSAGNAAAAAGDSSAAPPAGAESGKDAAPRPAGSTPSAPAAGITPPVAADSGDGFNRKLIYKANLVMEVADYGDAQTKLRNLAALSGAFILQFTETTNDRERSGNYTIKVAAQGFASFLDGLEQISPSLQRSVQGQDVTEEYVDLDARLKAKQAVEARLLAFMDKAQKTEDLVAFSNELSKVQTEIEQLKGRMRYLDQNVALSTIELRMYQKLEGTAGAMKTGQPAFLDRLEKTMSSSWQVLVEIAQGIVIVIAAVLPVLVLCGIGLVIYLLARKRRQRRLQQIRAELKRENATAALPPDDSKDNG